MSDEVFGLGRFAEPRVGKVAFGSRQLTNAGHIGDHARTVTHTQISWNMCMRRRPRRTEEGV